MTAAGSDSIPTVAIIMTCHNRRDTTVRCLEAVKAQQGHGARLDLFVTDDGSSDGTADGIRQAWANATVLQGTGHLYWAAGMALAERAAVMTGPDYLLWLNDDTLLVPDAVERLLATASQHRGAIVVGATIDPATGERSYGGRLRPGRHPQKLPALPLSDEPQRADTFNGNVVLVPWDVRQRVGPIDGLFPHAYADDDYGLRATAMGVPVLQAPGFVGSCRRNPPKQVPRSLRARWTQQQSPNGLPWQAQLRYLKRHGGAAWPVWLVAGQAKRLVGPSGESAEG